MTALLEAKALSLSYGAVHALRQVDLRVNAGEAVALIGESGSGKTSLCRCLLGLKTPTAGQVHFKGQALSSWPKRALRQQLQVVFQEPSLNPRLTIGAALGEPLALHRGLRGDAKKAAVAALLEQVGLSSALSPRYPHTLSGGQQQRVALARALAPSPEVLILDEPVSALDLSVQAQILTLLDELRRALSLTLLMVTHDLPVARALCERAVVLWRGEVVEEGPLEALLSNPAHPHTQALVHAARAAG